ncbi:hypothetical protein J2S90_002628 [Arthrobacter bambusae]|uniref:Uncharacterized protein n=1 Tax=Arthrobacter bambusae TaxID=1338426 RepID=A0AAW8DII1_9MICC|nr:hypothetical protein [Arthrobacter bambusae]MDQ0127261.1 hypothetical protein [Arthrobacter bambusae]MDQ0178603.1 hypothetical protein [Arthrobacter bambusae]
MDVNDIRRTIRCRVEEGEFTLLYLWITFRANGGVACRTSLYAFVHGLHPLSNNDTLVLGSVVQI